MPTAERTPTWPVCFRLTDAEIAQLAALAERWHTSQVGALRRALDAATAMTKKGAKP